MPGSHGGDQLDENYDPHSYINHEFVGSDQKYVSLKRWEYRVGWNHKGIVCERWPAHIHFSQAAKNTKPVLRERIPKKVLKEIQNEIESKRIAESNALPCCIQIEMGGSTLIQTLGPFTRTEVEDWLQTSGFVQHRQNLWLQKVAMSMDYCGTRVSLKDTKAWVHLLQKPEEIKFKKEP